MIMIVISFALVKFYAFAILYVLIVMQIKLVVIVSCVASVSVGFFRPCEAFFAFYRVKIGTSARTVTCPSPSRTFLHSPQI